MRPGANHSYAWQLVRDYVAMSRVLPCWRGLTAGDARGLLLSGGFSDLERFDQLLAVETYPVCADFFIVGARNPETTVSR